MKAPKLKPWFASLVLASGLAQAADNFEDGRRAYERGEYALARAKLLAAAGQGAAQLWFDRAARSGRPAARYMACAMARRASGAGSRPGPVYCLDRIAETGEPPARR
jgi:hypothetical protein